MNKKLPIVCFIAVVLFNSCQKELDEEDQLPFCAVSSIVVSNGAGKVTGRYTYEYDSDTQLPTSLNFQNIEASTTKTVIPIYSRDTIYLGENSYAVIDASKRITLLVDPIAPGGKTIGYYYNYDGLGYLQQRLIDDGFNDALRTNFFYDTSGISAFKQDFAGFPQSLSATVTPDTTRALSGFKQFALLELFPELILYMPAFQLGKTAAYPLAVIKANISATNLPASSFTNTYTNYTFTPEGWLSTFESKGDASRVESTRRYSFEYRCY